MNSGATKGWIAKLAKCHEARTQEGTGLRGRELRNIVTD